MQVDSNPINVLLLMSLKPDQVNVLTSEDVAHHLVKVMSHKIRKTNEIVTKFFAHYPKATRQKRDRRVSP